MAQEFASSILVIWKTQENFNYLFFGSFIGQLAFIHSQTFIDY